MSISPCSGTSGLQRLVSLKYNIVLKRESTFNLGLNAAKNTLHIQNSFQQKLFGIEFYTKKSPSTYVYLPAQCN